jgi:hypothetical protein
MDARHLSLALIVAALLLGAPALHGGPLQGEDAPATRCVKCKHAGRLPCPEHDKADCLLEEGAQLCTLYAGCEVCEGAGWVDCGRCDNEAIQEELERAAKRRPGLQKLVQPYVDGMQRPLMAAVSEHFVLVWDVEVLKVGRKRLDQHQLLHLYLGRMEELLADYKEFFVAEDSDFRNRFDVMVWGMELDQLRASQLFLENQSRNGVKLLGSTVRYSVAGTKANYKGDEELHRGLVHNVAHLILSHHRPSQWIGHRKGGWADAGVAHWFEDRYFGVCTNYCYQEQNTNRDFKGGRWRPAVRKIAQSGESHLPGLFEQNTNGLSLPQHAIAFSLVDFLQQHDKQLLSKLLRSLRNKRELRDALKSHFGWSVLELERKWKEWVLATYPPR